MDKKQEKRGIHNAKAIGGFPSISAAARYHGISPMTLRNWARRWPNLELDELIAQGKKKNRTTPKRGQLLGLGEKNPDKQYKEDAKPVRPGFYIF